jgi:hypothetical protein
MSEVVSTPGSSLNPFSGSTNSTDPIIQALDAYYGDTLTATGQDAVEGATTSATQTTGIPILEYASTVNTTSLEAIATYVAAQLQADSFYSNSALASSQGFLTLLEEAEELVTLQNELDSEQQQATTAQTNLQNDGGTVNSAVSAYNSAVSTYNSAVSNYNSELSKIQSQGPNDQENIIILQNDANQALSTYESNPTQDNLNAYENALNNYYNAQNSYGQLVNDFNTAASTLQGASDALSSAYSNLQSSASTYNQDASTYVGYFNNYNTLIEQATALSTGTTINDNTNDVTVPTINTFSAPGQTSAPTITNWPSNTSPPFNNPYNPSATSASNASTLNVGSIPNPPPTVSSNTIWGPILTRFATLSGINEGLQKIIDGALAAYGTIQQGDTSLFKKNPTSSAGDATPISSSGVPAGAGSSGSSSIASLIGGLGNSTLGSILATILNTQTNTSSQVNSNVTSPQLRTLAGLLLSIAQSSLGNTSQIAQQLGLGTVNQNSAAGVLVASLAVAAQILQVIANTSSTASLTTTTPPTNSTSTQNTNNTTPNLSTDQINLSLSAALVSSSLVGTSTYSASYVNDREEYNFLSQTEGSESALDVINANSADHNATVFQEFLNGTGGSGYNSANTTAYINSHFNNNGWPVQLTQQQQNSIISNISTALQNGQNVNNVISSDLQSFGIAQSQIASATTSISSTYNNALLGLLLTANVGTGTASQQQQVNGVTVNPALAQAASDFVNNSFVNNINEQGNTQRATLQSDQILSNVGQTIQQLDRTFTSVGQQAAATDNQTYISQQNDNIQDYFSNTLLLNPSTFAEALLAPSKNFIGLMYQGNKTGFKRGSIDVPIT